MKSLLICSSLFLISCVQLNGQMIIKENLKVNSKNKIVKLTVGNYQTTLEVSKNKIKVKYSNDYKKGKFTLKLKNKIPKEDGTFLLKGNQINQPFDILGNLKTTISYGPKQGGIENCTYQERQTVCRINNQGQRRCWEETVNVNGYKEVDFHNKFTKRNLNFTFDKLEISIASFKTNGTQIEKIYDYIGSCRRKY